ncbi:hypothetical protein B296_00048047 [Ensete ventricosum]|uniref:Uncharacterized protein n=1 Tax=Ensete ventricosum TaxID=4639 RepID=A0A426X5B9_ENSVE|nr:hypothetical protein B296_00048047 [Ensete ventricosum]
MLSLGFPQVVLESDCSCKRLAFKRVMKLNRVVLLYALLWRLAKKVASTSKLPASEGQPPAGWLLAGVVRLNHGRLQGRSSMAKAACRSGTHPLGRPPKGSGDCLLARATITDELGCRLHRGDDSGPLEGGRKAQRNRETTFLMLEFHAGGAGDEGGLDLSQETLFCSSVWVVGLGMASRGVTLVLRTSWFNCSSWIRAKEIAAIRVYGCRAFTSPRIFGFRPSIKAFLESLPREPSMDMLKPIKPLNSISLEVNGSNLHPCGVGSSVEPKITLRVRDPPDRVSFFPSREVNLHA